MSARPYRLRFLVLLPLLQLAGIAQAIPVRGDGGKADVELTAGADAIDDFSLPPALGLPAPTSISSAVPASSPSTPVPRRLTPLQVPIGDVLPGRELNDSSVVPHARTATPVLGESDPLARTLRSIVNVSRQQNATEPSLYAPQPDYQFGFDFGDSARNAVQETKELLAGTIQTILDPHADDNGRITFSLAGFDGLFIINDGSAWSLGVGDTLLASFQSDRHDHASKAHAPGSIEAAAAEDRFPGEGGMQGARQAGAAPDEFLVVINFLEETIENPLAWFVMALLIAIRFAVSLISMRATRRKSGRSRRRTSRRNSGMRPSPAALDTDTTRS